MKKILAMILAVLMLLAMAGCASGDELASVQSQLEEAQKKIEKLEEELEKADVDTVYALNATIDGETAKIIDGETSLTAQAVLGEGQVVDHWELNGEVQADAGEESFTFTASETATVEAVLRAEKKVTTVNCEIRLLDEKGKAGGDAYTEFAFEEPYTNPLTEEEITDGTVSFEVKAVVPKDYEVDYWLINGVEYHPNTTTTSIVVKNLNEATEYEVVVKEKPITYYRVTCYGCTVNGKTDLRVAAGTTVTANANGGYYSQFTINGESMNDRWSGKKSWTFTVTGDTHVEAYAIIN